MLVLLMLITFLLVCFHGCLGSILFSSRLFPGLITIHMLLALAIVILLIYARLLVRGQPEVLEVQSLKGLKSVKWVSLLLMLLMLVQLTVGTQVREMIDQIAEAYNYLYRESWVARTGFVFNIHRDLALAVLVAGLLGSLQVRRIFQKGDRLRMVFMASLLLILLQVLSGMLLTRYSLLPVLQPVHLLVSCIIIGLQFYFLHEIYNKKISLIQS